MPTIVFIYRINNDPQRYYGKYITDYISDDHEGLDTEIQPIVLQFLNVYRTQTKSPEFQSYEVSVGIVSFSFSKDSYMNYTTRKEVECFDFYYISFSNRENDIIEECWIGDFWSCKMKNSKIVSIEL
jgi:homoserine acetyltransferase